MDSKKIFWVVATVITLAGVAAAVAYFVTRYLRAQECDELLDDYCDFDCDECELCDECDACLDAEPAEEAPSAEAQPEA